MIYHDFRTRKKFKSLKLFAVSMRELAWRGSAKFTLHFVGSVWNGLAEKSNSSVLEIKGAQRRGTRNFISLFLAALARKCAVLMICTLNFEPLPLPDMSFLAFFHIFRALCLR